MAVRTRYATVEDLDTVLDMWWQLHRFHNEELDPKGRNPYVADATDKLREHYLKDVLPKRKVLIAEDGGKAVGFCEFGTFVRPPIYQERICIDLRCLYVVPAYRRKAVGRKLLNDVDTVRRLAHLKKIDVRVHINNKDAMAFYSSLGFRKRMVEMSRP